MTSPPDITPRVDTNKNCSLRIDDRIDMNNLLHHPTRIALALGGILFSLIAVALFDVAPITLLSAFFLIIQFITSKRTSLTIVGYGMLLLVGIVSTIGRIEIKNTHLDLFFGIGGLVLMLLALIHLVASRPPQNPILK